MYGNGKTKMRIDLDAVSSSALGRKEGKLPRYSIVMAVFNSDQTLARAIDSIRFQTFDDWELVAVNDGSTDRSLDVLNEYALDDERIRVISQQNRGPGPARQIGLSACRGDYVAFLDSDDYWEVDFLELVETQRVTNGSDVLFIERIHEREDGSGVGRSNVGRNRNATKSEIIRRQMTGLIPWGMWKVFRRGLLKEIREGFSDLEVGEEAVFSFEVVNAARSVDFVDKPIYHHVKRREGQHKKGGPDPWLAVVRAMAAHLNKVGEFKHYESTINSFALRSLCISVYRIACETPSRKRSLQLMAESFTVYSDEFDFGNLDRDSLDCSSMLIFAFLKLGLSGALITLSRARKRHLSY